MHLQPHVKLGGSHSTFSGQPRCLQPLRRCTQTDRSTPLLVQASKVCDLTGKTANNGYNVTFSHKRNRRKQYANLQTRKLYWTEGQRWVHLKVSTKAIRTVEMKGSRGAGGDQAPMNKDWLGKSRRMKNPEKLAASKKQPLEARYLSGRVVLLRKEAPSP
ncbi:hypothetical protein WJX84_002185 [Apatococcus fuscideae]|uniref:Large ribosomal subunit protein bL28c n=1 Tax=Apatococcus fuscideae TaxID=2026836 RepID=A0AAW1SRT4_9CHLO